MIINFIAHKISQNMHNLTLISTLIKIINKQLCINFGYEYIDI